MVPNPTTLGPSRLGMRILSEFRGPKQALGPSQECEAATRRRQGGTEAAPRMHQGCAEDASSNDLCIEMGPRAPFKSNKVLEHITVDRSALI